MRHAAHLLDAVAGQDVGAYYSAPPRERPFAEELDAEVGALKIAFSTRGPAGFDTHQDCIGAVDDAAKLCMDLGHHVDEAAPPLTPGLLDAMGEAFLGTLAIETACDLDEFARRTGRKLNADDFDATTWAFAERGRSYAALDAVRFKRVLHAVARAVGPFFERYDCYLSPTLGRPPVPVGLLDPAAVDLDAYFAKMFEFMPFTALFNITGSAAVSLPLSWNADGIPIGVQFATRMGRDGLLLCLAAQLERTQPWCKRRPPVLQLDVK